MDIDRNGVVLAARSPAGTWPASIDGKCRGPLNGTQTANRPALPRRVSRFYPEPLPQLKGVVNRLKAAPEASYYTWVDQFRHAGFFGANVPINTGNASEGLLALKGGKMGGATGAVSDGVSTPSGWDGRIDDAGTGAAGKGTRAVFLGEHRGRAVSHGEDGQRPPPAKVVKFQLRPDPLAK